MTSSPDAPQTALFTPVIRRRSVSVVPTSDQGEQEQVDLEIVALSTPFEQEPMVAEIGDSGMETESEAEFTDGGVEMTSDEDNDGDIEDWVTNDSDLDLSYIDSAPENESDGSGMGDISNGEDEGTGDVEDGKGTGQDKENRDNDAGVDSTEGSHTDSCDSDVRRARIRAETSARRIQQEEIADIKELIRVSELLQSGRGEWLPCDFDENPEKYGYTRNWDESPPRHRRRL